MRRFSKFLASLTIVSLFGGCLNQDFERESLAKYRATRASTFVGFNPLPVQETGESSQPGPRMAMPGNGMTFPTGRFTGPAGGRFYFSERREDSRNPEEGLLSLPVTGLVFPRTVQAECRCQPMATDSPGHFCKVTNRKAIVLRGRKPIKATVSLNQVVIFPFHAAVQGGTPTHLTNNSVPSIIINVPKHDRAV